MDFVYVGALIRVAHGVAAWGRREVVAIFATSARPFSLQAGELLQRLFHGVADLKQVSDARHIEDVADALFE